MTPIRKKESLQVELIGLQHLLEITPQDEMATPALKSRIQELLDEIKKIETNPLLKPETELFFSAGPVIGSRGLEASFAGNILRRFQDMVTNHFAAKYCGGLRRMGRRKGEEDSALFLSALPIGSFGLQLSQPHVKDFVTSMQVTETMEDLANLVTAAAKDDASFVETISHFNSRVIVPLQKFLEVLNNAGADCRMLSGRVEAALKKEDVVRAYDRVMAVVEESHTLRKRGLFFGVLVQSGKFEFQPTGENLMTGWVSESVSESTASEWDRKLTGIECNAEISVTTVSTPSGRRSFRNELITLSPILTDIDEPI